MDDFISESKDKTKFNGDRIIRKSRKHVLKYKKALTAKEQLFVNYLLTGDTCGDVGKSYLAAGFIVPVNMAKAKGNQLLKKEKVSEELARIRLILDEKAKKKGIDFMTIDEKRSFLARVVRSDIDDPDKLAIQEKSIDMNGNVKLKLCNKLEALKLDNDIAGDTFRDRDTLQNNMFNFLISMSKFTTNNSLPAPDLSACNAQAEDRQEGLPAPEYRRPACLSAQAGAQRAGKAGRREVIDDSPIQVIKDHESSNNS